MTKQTGGRKLNPNQLKSLPVEGGMIQGERCSSPYSDGGGLYFVVTPTGLRSWMIRTMWRGKRIEFSVGAYPAISLDAARDLATQARTDVKQGVDPRDRFSQGDMRHTFILVARRHIPDWIDGQWARAGEVWERMLRAVPSLHDIPVAAMTNEDVLTAIRPIWKTTPVTASRFLVMIAKVMQVAITDGLRKHANPAQWKGNIALKFNKSPRQMQFVVKGAKRFTRKSLPFPELPDFMQKLAYDTTIAARAVEFVILTGGRSQEAFRAEWSWYDEARGLLNIPAHVMGKTKEPHTVVLCEQAIALLASLPRRSKYIFPSDYNACERDAHVRGHALLYRVRKIAPVDVHGFRATFRNHAGAETDAQFETCEAALAHKIGNDTTRAYLNDPLYKKRAKLMAEWGAFACSKTPKTAPTAAASTNVVPFKAA